MVLTLQSFPVATVNTTQWGLPISAKDPVYGAIGDGVADDTVAIQAWLAAIPSGGSGLLPAGNYIVRSPLVKAAGNISICGEGAYQSVITYGGPSTSADIFTVGDGVNQYTNWFLKDFRIASNVLMTGGSAFHFKLMTRSMLRGLVADGQDGNGKLWNGFWFDGVDFVTLIEFQAVAQNDAMRVNGGGAGIPKADLSILAGKITNSGTGIRIGGGFGGFSCEQCDIIGNGNNVIIDQTLTANMNREIHFGPQCFLDSATTTNCLVNDTGSAGILRFIGTWLASAGQDGLRLVSGNQFSTEMVGAIIFNNGRDGVRNESTVGTTQITGCKITSNAGIGVNNTVTNTNISAVSNLFSGNGTDNAGLTLGGHFNSSPIRYDGNPTLNWFSDSTNATISIGNGANAALAVACGAVFVIPQNGGNNTALYVLGGGGVALAATSGATWVAPTSSPGAGKASINFDGGTTTYRIYNNIGSTVTFGVCMLKLNSGT